MMICDEIVARTNIIDVATFYGMEVNRGKTICPFHNDSKPSLSFKNNRYKCFVCGEGGSVIDLVKKLFSISTTNAIIKINNDFRLELSTGKSSPTEVNEHKKKQLQKKKETDWKKTVFETYMYSYEYYRSILRYVSPTDEMEEVYKEAVDNVEACGYVLDVLLGNNEFEQADIYNNCKVEVKRLRGLYE